MGIEDIRPFLGTPYVDFCEGRDKGDARNALANAQQGRKGRFIGFAATADGTPKWGDVAITPIFMGTQTADLLLVISRDITEQKKATGLLAEREHLLRQAQSYAHIGNWSLDADGVTANWSDEIYRVLGLDPSNEPGPVTLRKTIHPDDFKDVKTSLKTSLNTGVEHRKQQIPVLFLTAYKYDEISKNHNLPKTFGFLSKPVMMEELGQKLTELFLQFEQMQGTLKNSQPDEHVE